MHYFIVLSCCLHPGIYNFRKIICYVQMSGYSMTNECTVGGGLWFYRLHNRLVWPSLMSDKISVIHLARKIGRGQLSQYFTFLIQWNLPKLKILGTIFFVQNRQALGLYRLNFKQNSYIWISSVHTGFQFSQGCDMLTVFDSDWIQSKIQPH